MSTEASCSSYKLDEWGICHYKIDCMLDTCTNNCYRDRTASTKLIRRQTNMDLSDITTPASTDWLTTPEYPSHRLETDCDFEARKLLYYAKIASRYPATPVVVGEVKDMWEDYVTSTLHAVITYPVQDVEFTGFKRVECHIVLQSPSEVVQLARSIHEGRVLVVDEVTKQILAACSSFY